MGLFGALGKFCFVVVLALAVLIGYLSTLDKPLAPVFVTVFKLQGIGKPLTPPVPKDEQLSPRPAGEMFLTLPSGAKMPANGIGMCCRHTAYDMDSVESTILWYLLKGGRHIDTADVYTNHEAIGRGIAAAMKRGIPRSEIYVVTKVFPSTFGYNETLKNIPRFLKELGLDYIDLVLMHAPRDISPRLLWNMKFGGPDEFVNYHCKTGSQCRKDTWRALSEVQQQGLVKDVGVSNFMIDHLQELEAMKLAPIAANQMQFHPWAPPSWQKVVKYCQEKNIAITAYYSFGGLQQKDQVFGVEGIQAIAKSHGRPTSQVLLRWALQKGFSVIPGTGNPKHMSDNLDVYSFELSDSDMAKLADLASHPVKDGFLFMDF